jgi:predicted MFS family arabinose efflux permease
MTLALAEPNQAGRRLGQIQAAGAIGSFLGLGAGLAMYLSKVPIRPMYFVAGGAALVAAGCCLGIPRDIKTPGPRFVFRKEYRLYYMLTFLEGWRKQIVLAFGSFLLVKVYHTSLAAMLLLWMVVQAAGWLTSPRVGRLIDRVGERKVLIFYYSSMAVVFCGYIALQLLPDYLKVHAPAVGAWLTFERVKYMLWALFVLDSAFFVFAMAMTTYVRKIAPVAEHTPTLSMGVAMNHVSAVTMPLLGGYLWAWYGSTGPFWAGIFAAIASAALAFLVPPPHKMPRAE